VYLRLKTSRPSQRKLEIQQDNTFYDLLQFRKRQIHACQKFLVCFLECYNNNNATNETVSVLTIKTPSQKTNNYQNSIIYSLKKILQLLTMRMANDIIQMISSNQEWWLEQKKVPSMPSRRVLNPQKWGLVKTKSIEYDLKFGNAWHDFFCEGAPS